jgi:hypothetical protein
MENPKEMVGDIARVVDLLEQIKEVNKMIVLHSGKDGSPSQKRQYEDIKERFLAELKDVLAGFDVNISFRKKAA